MNIITPSRRLKPISRLVTASECRRDCVSFAEADYLKIYSQSSRPIHGPIGIIDFGTNSVDLIVRDLSGNKLAEFGKQCGIGRGTVPYDAHARFDKNGVKLLRNDVLPEWNGMIDKYHPQTMIFIGTAFVRAALANPDKTARAETISVLKEVADSVCMPCKAMTVASGQLEARLAGLDMQRGGLRYDYGFHFGGGSMEAIKPCKDIIDPDFCMAPSIGMLNLQNSASPLEDIRSALDTIPYLKPIMRDQRAGIIVLSGGPARLGINVLKGPDSFHKKMPLGGYTVEAGEKLNNKLEKLPDLTTEDLYQRAFGAPAAKAVMETRTDIKKIDHVQVFDTWITLQNFRSLDKEWRTNVGSRVEQLKHVAQCILAIDERVQPRLINFGRYNIRREAFSIAMTYT